MASASTSSLKKRKREASPAREIAFKLASHSVAPGEVGPVLVSFPSLDAPPSTAFRCYRKKTKTSDDDADVTVAGETDAVEFESNAEETRRVAGAGCRYVIAVHNKRTSELTVLPTAMSPYILSSHCSRRNLWTKKAKAAIRARERNRVDVGAMEGVMDFVMAEEAKELRTTADRSRRSLSRPLTPLIAFYEAGSAYERKQVLPFRGSDWVNARVEATMEQADKDKDRKRTLKILFYIATMMAFHRATNRKFKKEDLPTKLNNVPQAVIDSLLGRFTECTRDSTEPRTTPQLELLLLAHLFALCLRIDNYAADHALIARDLSLAPEKITAVFRSLGCKIVTLGERERTKLGLPDSVADEKRAVLTAPVQFPKQRMKKKTR
ncbi:Rpa49 subunit specific to nuclear RNA polymerase I [Mycena leptocephala]|nr:Rpa49 subunit specific to nuclear RNA polymerase I [Mycena leptocephala]